MCLTVQVTVEHLATTTRLVGSCTCAIGSCLQGTVPAWRAGAASSACGRVAWCGSRYAAAATAMSRPAAARMRRPSHRTGIALPPRPKTGSSMGNRCSLQLLSEPARRDHGGVANLVADDDQVAIRLEGGQPEPQQ